MTGTGPQRGEPAARRTNATQATWQPADEPAENGPRHAWRGAPGRKKAAAPPQQRHTDAKSRRITVGFRSSKSGPQNLFGIGRVERGAHQARSATSSVTVPPRRRCNSTTHKPHCSVSAPHTRSAIRRVMVPPRRRCDSTTRRPAARAKPSTSWFHAQPLLRGCTAELVRSCGACACVAHVYLLVRRRKRNSTCVLKKQPEGRRCAATALTHTSQQAARRKTNTRRAPRERVR